MTPEEFFEEAQKIVDENSGPDATAVGFFVEGIEELIENWNNQ